MNDRVNGLNPRNRPLNNNGPLCGHWAHCPEQTDGWQAAFSLPKQSWAYFRYSVHLPYIE